MLSTKQSLARILALAAALGATSSAFAADPPDISPKEQMHLDMIALARQMADLRPQMASDETAAALHAQLETAYQRMSDELGGDDPGRQILSSVDRASRPVGDLHGRPPNARPTNPRHVLGERSEGGDEGGIAGNLATPPGCVTQSDVFFNATDFPLPTTRRRRQRSL
jgi:hypothetical protein